MAEPGEVWMAPRPRCPVHGQMSPTNYGYECHGFDGEGCPFRAVPLEDMDWTRIGTTEGVEGMTILGLEVRVDPSLGPDEWRIDG